MSRPIRAALQRADPAVGVTPRDLQFSQEFVNVALGQLQNLIEGFERLEFVSLKPSSSSAKGSRLQAYLDRSGALYLCVATNSWVKFSGATF